MVFDLNTRSIDITWLPVSAQCSSPLYHIQGCPTGVDSVCYPWSLRYLYRQMLQQAVIGLAQLHLRLEVVVVLNDHNGRVSLCGSVKNIRQRTCSSCKCSPHFGARRLRHRQPESPDHLPTCGKLARPLSAVKEVLSRQWCLFIVD